MLLSTLTLVPLVSSLAAASLPPSSTDSGSSPNPIATQYPNSTTGTTNGTISVIPIPYSLARSIIPAKYDILKKAYEELLPGFPRDSYPFVVRAGLDHDIQDSGISIPDFQKVGLSYPFIDLLGDGFSSFTYSKYLPVTATSLVAQTGTALYGTIPVLADFDPSGQAYAFNVSSGEIFSNAYAPLSKDPIVLTSFADSGAVGPWPVEFYVNFTNQPTFTNAVTCDNMLNLWNSSVSTGKNAPVGVIGDVVIKAPHFPSDMTFCGVHGVKVDTAFIETNYLPCESLKG